MPSLASGHQRRITTLSGQGRIVRHADGTCAFTCLGTCGAHWTRHSLHAAIKAAKAHCCPTPQPLGWATTSVPGRWRPRVELAAGPWVQRPAWLDAAACADPDVDPDWFTTDEGSDAFRTALVLARSVCRRCPVRAQCRALGDRTGDFGVYGGQPFTVRMRRLQRQRSASLKEAS
jgi:WhiB family transcriptional regulator, redox-sensing transcriptional regulator